MSPCADARRVQIGGILIRKKGRFEASRPAAHKTAAEKAAAPKKQPAPGSGKKAAVIAACAVLLVVLGVCTYGFILKGSDTIFPNVYVAGVNVGGLKRDAAINAVKTAVETQTAGDTLKVILPDRTIEFTPDVTNVALNPDEAADAAMNYGRDGGPIKALITYQKAKNSRQDISLESGTDLDTAYIRDLIDQTARACKSEKIEPVVTVDEDAKTITVVTGSPAISLDADKLYDAVVARFEAGNFSDLQFEYDTDPCEAVDLQKYYDQFGSEMKDAYYDEEKKELVAEKVGFGFDVSYYTQQIALADAGTTITIQAEELKPEVTLEDLEKEYFADVLGSCDSPHTAQAGRTKNLELACKAIDGTILNPGDEFSFNKIVGERTAEKGYQAAIVYQTGGKSESELGGGVCQVASTIYTATLYADLKVTQRAPHMFIVTYVEAGMDATIYWPSLDYKFVNSTDHPIRIDASVSGGYVHIKLMGTKPTDRDYDHIVLRHSTVNTVQPKMAIDGDDETIITDAGTAVDENGNTVNLVVDKDGNKYVKGAMVQYSYVGYTVIAYRDYVDANGNVVKTETLHKDVYNSRNATYKCTPYVEPEIPEEPDPTDPTDPDNPDVPTEPTEPTEPDNPFDIWS
mgnify:CR=1 FL=1